MYDRYMNFLAQIDHGYKNVTYHNKTHAVDVAQTFYYFCSTCNLIEMCNLDEVDMFALITAAACHDFKHPGYNNAFMTASRDQLAILYNDQAVLENMHIASSFALIKDDSNFLEELDEPLFRRIRSTMISSVLATDMARHFTSLGMFKSKQAQADFKPSEVEADKKMTTDLFFHMADISNPTKTWEICRLWTDLLFVEFFDQGDQERNLSLPVSQFMDRNTTNIAKAQIGFIDFIIKPIYSAGAAFIPKLAINLENVDVNKKQWTGMFEEYEAKMENKNADTSVADRFLQQAAEARL